MKKQTFRQRLLRLLYPLIRKMGNKKLGKTITNTNNITPSQSFYNLEVEKSNGKKIPFSELKGKKVMLVNTASDCGYTGQYEELQSLHEQFKEELTIIGFPANDFGEQEKGSDAKISEFCQLNYGVSFPIAKKANVVSKSVQQPVFKWLTHKEDNGWNTQEPEWNFSKFLINEEGTLTHYFGPSVSPTAKEVVDIIKQ